LKFEFYYLGFFFSRHSILFLINFFFLSFNNRAGTEGLASHEWECEKASRPVGGVSKIWKHHWLVKLCALICHLNVPVPTRTLDDLSMCLVGFNPHLTHATVKQTRLIKTRWIKINMVNYFFYFTYIIICICIINSQNKICNLYL